MDVVQNENIDGVEHKSPSLDNTSNLTQVSDPKENMHTLGENSSGKIRNELDIVMTTVETRVQDAVLTAIEDLINTRVELAEKSTNASLGCRIMYSMQISEFLWVSQRSTNDGFKYDTFT